MKIKLLKLKDFKNLSGQDGWFDLNLEKKDNMAVLIGNNGSGKSNVIEAISAIFAGLYESKNKEVKPSFEYKIEYWINGNKIFIELRKNRKEYTYYFKINDINQTKVQFESNINNYLPSQIIVNYSGEELRLWKHYYKRSYLEYSKGVRFNTISLESNQKMLYVNKYYWDIALLTMLASDISLDDIMPNLELKSINILFNLATLNDFSSKNSNDVTKIMNLLSKNSDRININLNEFKERVEYETHKRLFNILAMAYLPENYNDKLLTDFVLIFNNNLTTSDFSEGEKKKILLKFILTVLADEKSLILLDEPDTHIHIAHKKQIKEMIEQSEKDTLLTTHSPTLTHSFEDHHISMINNGEIEDKHKQEIFSHITDGIWNYHEQSVFLSSPYNIDLIVEGKFDKIHIETAIKSDNLGADFPDLKFGVFDLKSCDNMKKIFDGLCNADNLHIPNKKIIFIFDNEKQFFNGQNLLGKEFLGAEKIKDNLYKKKSIYLLFLPKKIDFTENFTIENMYPSEKFANCLQETLTRRLEDGNYFNNFIDFITDGIKEDAKKLLSEKCLGYEKSDFTHFKKLFELITDAKNDGN